MLLNVSWVVFLFQYPLSARVFSRACVRSFAFEQHRNVLHVNALESCRLVFPPRARVALLVPFCDSCRKACSLRGDKLNGGSALEEMQLLLLQRGSVTPVRHLPTDAAATAAVAAAGVEAEMLFVLVLPPPLPLPLSPYPFPAPSLSHDRSHEHEVGLLQLCRRCGLR